MDILHRLLVQAVVVHVFVVRFVNVPLFSDERRMKELLQDPEEAEKNRMRRRESVRRAEREGDWSCVLPACPTNRDGFK